jgi:hypothetical protein
MCWRGNLNRAGRGHSQWTDRLETSLQLTGPRPLTGGVRRVPCASPRPDAATVPPARLHAQREASAREGALRTIARRGRSWIECYRDPHWPSAQFGTALVMDISGMEAFTDREYRSDVFSWSLEPVQS